MSWLTRWHQSQACKKTPKQASGNTDILLDMRLERQKTNKTIALLELMFVKLWLF
jgi:hypothetical protein